MDEPFSAQIQLAGRIYKMIYSNHKLKTIVFVTHDIEEAMKMGDRICLLNQGHVEQIGTTEDFIHRPKNDFVKSFIGNVDACIKASEVRDIATNFRSKYAFY